jgi:hypothetical protein
MEIVLNSGLSRSVRHSRCALVWKQATYEMATDSGLVPPYFDGLITPSHWL